MFGDADSICLEQSACRHRLLCPTASNSCKYDVEEPSLTGKVLGKFIINMMAKIVSHSITFRAAMTLVINVNISVWKRITSEYCNIYTIYLHTSSKYTHTHARAREYSLSSNDDDTRYSIIHHSTIRCYNSANFTSVESFSTIQRSLPIYMLQRISSRTYLN